MLLRWKGIGVVGGVCLRGNEGAFIGVDVYGCRLLAGEARMFMEVKEERRNWNYYASL